MPLKGGRCFFSSHDLSEIEQVADRAGILSGGNLLLDISLDDLREHCRLVIASGTNLPEKSNGHFASVRSEGQFFRYLVTHRAVEFVAGLERQGAVITANSPATLREVFLELVRKEEPCISGNAGETLAAPSFSF